MVIDVEIEKLVIGYLKTNCYILKKGNKSIIIDPAGDFESIEEATKNTEVVGCFVTHHHFDHTGALDKVLRKYKITENPKEISGFVYELISTPGHMINSVTIYFPESKAMFSGDFLFYRTIGRVDLPNSNSKDMLESLRKIESYPDDIVVYPGHGRSTILGEEKEYFNYYEESL